VSLLIQLFDGISDLVVFYALAMKDQQQLAWSTLLLLLLPLLVLTC
jgi:hypothetical protein